MTEPCEHCHFHEPEGGTVVSDTYVTGPDGSTNETMVDSFGDKVQISTPPQARKYLTC